MSDIQRNFLVSHAGASKGVLCNALAKQLGWNVFDADFALEYTMARTLEQKRPALR